MLKLIDVEGINTNVNSSPIVMINYNKLAFQVNASSTEIFSEFVMKIQASIDGVNYVDVVGSSEIFTADKSHIIEIPEPCSTMYRVAIVFATQGVEGESINFEVFAEFKG